MKTKRFIPNNLRLVVLFVMCFNYTFSQDTSIPKAEKSVNSEIDFAALKSLPSFTFKMITMEYGSLKQEKEFKGTFTIKDGYLNIQTKEFFNQFKILSYKDGVMTCLDKDFVQTYKITDESGKIKGNSYDTRIDFVADKKMGGAATYWCKKE